MSSSSRAKHVVRAAGALVWRERRGRLEVLLVHRPRYDDWSFPKGKVEPGESPQAALARELREELNIVANIGMEVMSDIPLSAWPLKPGLQMRVWLVSTDRPEISPGTSHMQVKWVTPVQALDLNWLAPDLPIVRQIIKLMGAGQGKCVQS